MIITFNEIFYAVVLTVVLAYIFMDFFRQPKNVYDLMYTRGFRWDDFKFAAIVVAPAILLHEMGHKFVAIGFGLPASFNIFWGGLGLAILLKLVHSPFLILAPAYVLIPAAATPFQQTFIAAAGPLTNLLIWFIASQILKKKRLSRMQLIGWGVTKKLNMWLFIFNVIPFPPLDGYNIVRGVIGIIF